MPVNLPPLLALYSWRNTGTFGNYSDRKLGAKWPVAAYYVHTRDDSKYAIAPAASTNLRERSKREDVLTVGAAPANCVHYQAVG
jgi:hypothetical protein